MVHPPRHDLKEHRDGALGSSGLQVSRIAPGTMGFGDGTVPFWSWALPWEDGKDFFAQALDLGITC
jgi:aryl-alcohol dehydrogenase-like predicted oxidoreductase